MCIRDRLGVFGSSSYRTYAVDFDNDGKRDLWNSTADALASIANYLSRHGWVPDAPIAELTNLKGQVIDKLLNKGLKPWLSLTNLTHHGINTTGFSPQEKAFNLMGMKSSQDQTEVWAGYHNFYVISRYNHSRRYAMAVYNLSRKISRNRK